MCDNSVADIILIFHGVRPAASNIGPIATPLYKITKKKVKKGAYRGPN